MVSNRASQLSLETFDQRKADINRQSIKKLRQFYFFTPLAVKSLKYSKFASKKLASIFLGSNVSGDSCDVHGVIKKIFINFNTFCLENYLTLFTQLSPETFDPRKMDANFLEDDFERFVLSTVRDDENVFRTIQAFF